MYFLMLASLPCCPTVLTKYPPLQNSPPHSVFFTFGQVVNISRAVMLLMICTILFIRTIHRHRLYQEVYVVLVCANLNERHLISFADFQTSLFQLFVHRRCKYDSPIFCWTHNVVQKHRYIMTLIPELRFESCRPGADNSRRLPKSG